MLTSKGITVRRVKREVFPLAVSKLSLELSPTFSVK